MTMSSVVRGAPRVLLVVEHQPIAEVVKLTLSHGVFEVRSVRDAEEAITQIEAW